MNDPFVESLEPEEVAAGPFRTGSPTAARRLERARQASLARVAERTAEEIHRERARRARTERGLLAVTTLSGLAVAGVLLMMALNVLDAAAWFCPALSAFISMSLLTWKSRALTDAWSPPE